MKRFLLLSLLFVGLMRANDDKEQDQVEQEQRLVNFYAQFMILCAQKELNGQREAARALFEKGTQELKQVYPKIACKIVEQAFELVEQKLSTNQTVF